MGREVLRVARAVLTVLLAGAAAAQAQLPLSVDDARVAETSSGIWVLPVTVRLPTAPTGSDVTVNWTLVAGSATAGSDFITSSGTLTFSVAFMEATKNVNVQINGDTTDEWSPTLQQDEVFWLELSNPSGNAVIQKGRGTITLIDDDRLRPGVQFLTAVSGGNISIGATTLQWRIPGAQAPVTDVFVGWKIGAGCSFPSSTTDITGGLYLGSAAGPGLVQTWTHTPSPAPNTTYCYSVFAIYSGTPVTGPEITNVKTRTFDATGAIAWSYATGATSVVPPTIGQDAVYTTDNEGVVHAMLRGAAGGGVWPTGWNPLSVGKPTQNRSAVIPFNGNWRLLLGTDGGGVHMIDARYGHVLWSRSSAFGSALLSLGGTQAQPAALLKAYGGNNDMVLVGSNNGGSNAFYALNLATGANLVSPFTHAQMGGVLGMAVVSYPSRVFFLTNASSATVYGLDLGPTGSPALTLASLSGPNPHAFAGSNGSAVLRNNKLIFPDSGGGQVFALDVTTGATYNNPTGDGVAKGFVWPDRRDDRLYFSGDTKVQGWRDLGSTFLPIWSTPVMTSPSIVLQKPGSDYLYVGDGLGNLVQIDVNNPSSPLPLPLPGGGQIGAPSLDGANNLVLVGSSTGTIYAVRVPF